MSYSARLQPLRAAAVLCAALLFVALFALLAPDAEAGEAPLPPDPELADGKCNDGLPDPDCYHYAGTFPTKRECENEMIRNDPLVEDVAPGARKNPELMNDSARLLYKRAAYTATFRCTAPRGAKGGRELYRYISDRNCAPSTRIENCPAFRGSN